MKRNIIFPGILFFSIFFLFSSCHGGNKAIQEHITVTIEPLRFFTEKIAGDRLPVQTMVPSGSNPETYEPTPRQLVELSHSPFYIKIGEIGFETTWMQKLQENAPHMKVIDSSKGIRYIADKNGIKDPHTWMSCNNAEIIAKNIYQALLSNKGHLYKCSHTDSIYYTRNYKKLLVEIQTTRRNINQVSKRGKAFVIYHPILTYFAQEFGYSQIPMEEEGREPSARQMQAVIETAKREKVKTVFIQKEFSPRNAMLLITTIHANPTEINPLNYNWPKEMTEIAKDIR